VESPAKTSLNWDLTLGSTVNVTEPSDVCGSVGRRRRGDHATAGQDCHGGGRLGSAGTLVVRAWVSFELEPRG
jgi:hypothetical protein